MMSKPIAISAIKALAIVCLLDALGIEDFTTDWFIAVVALSVGFNL